MASATTSDTSRIIKDSLKAVINHSSVGDHLTSIPCGKDQDICDGSRYTFILSLVKGCDHLVLFMHIPKALVMGDELRLMFGGAKYKQQSNLVTSGLRYYGLARAAKQPIRREKSAEKLWELLASEKFITVQEIKDALTTHGYPGTLKLLSCFPPCHTPLNPCYVSQLLKIS